jgi:hypothetical protein
MIRGRHYRLQEMSEKLGDFEAFIKRLVLRAENNGENRFLALTYL